LIPIVAIGELFEEDVRAWTRADQAFFAAASEVGFVAARGLPVDVGAQAQSRLLRIFGLSDAQKRRLQRRKFSPENRNVYRGWFPLQPGHLTSKEGIDIGGDVAHGPGMTGCDDPLREASALPEEQTLPGWRADISSYYLAMERIARALMHSLARSLGLPQDYFDLLFHQGLSTLRLIRYPPRDPAELASIADPGLWVENESARCHLVGAPHTDSGFVTLLAQDGVGGLQARTREGLWVDVPPAEDTLVINFGQVLEQWTSGRIRATEHRVLGSHTERHSIPFFYEARAAAVIQPLPIDPPNRFAPFRYGDFLWNRMTSFVEFRGLQRERPARSPTDA
jgi:isopenicillin N synthase-like dioxygenase